MTKRYLATLPDGRLAVTQLNGLDPDGAKLAKALFELSRGTEKNTHFDPSVHTLAAIAAGIPGHSPLTTVEVDEADLPYHILGNGDPAHGMCLDPNCHDRYFRNAMVWDNTQTGKCRCDMPKARGVHMDCIRLCRNEELVKKDVTFMRAVEAGDTSAQATIATEKQVLRDIPQTFDLTTDTPIQLKARWPSELPARE